MAVTAGSPSSNAEAVFAEAHRALRADSAVQFDLPPAKPPEPPPEWLIAALNWLSKVFEPVGRFFAWLNGLMPDAPYARILLWSVIAIAFAGLVWVAASHLIAWRRALGPARVATTADGEAEEALPGARSLRQWLHEADRLADEERYEDAVHHLLVCSVEDIARRRPQLVRPSLTSRDLSRAEALPARARSLFSGIAAVVERSLFGGRPVGAEEWRQCRAAYSDFADTRAWSA